MAKIVPRIYGLLARFPSAEALVAASRRLAEAGYRNFDAYTPYPVEGLAQAMRLPSSWLPFLIFAGGVTGALVGYLMQWFATVINYPLNIGGRPLHSWPAYIPITFELTILFAAFAGVLGMFIVTRFPQPYHPVFNVEDFREHGARDGFYLSIQSRDAKFDTEGTRKLLEDLGSEQVSVIEE